MSAGVHVVGSLLYLGWGQAEVIRLLALKFYLVFVSLIQNCSKLFYRECNTFTIFFRYRTGQRVTVWRRRKCKWLKNQEKGSPLTNLDKKYNNFFPWYILTKKPFYQNKKSDCTSWLLHTKKHYPHRQRRIQQTSERSQFSTSLEGQNFWWWRVADEQGRKG